MTKKATDQAGDTARRRSRGFLRDPGATYGPGRPPVHEEEWTRVTVVLLNRQIVALDLLAADIRAATGAVVKRAEILRALVDALTESGLDLTAAPTESALKKTLLSHLRKDTHEPRQ